MQNVLTVSQVNRYIKEIVARDIILGNMWVKGEISNYKNHYSGHMYFTIKDESGILKCVMFKTQNSSLKFVPENGMKVIIRGHVSVFERDGQYQLYAEEMQPDGIGNLHLAFEQLKKKLQAEGMFDQEHKKRLPFLPGAIGVVTSSTGSVIRDIINILSRRYYNVQVKIISVAVQGEYAAGQIAAAVEKFNVLGCVDVIIIARGGGSLEELWAFNEEIVARSVYNSKIPVISAVGHETDFTICDFAADLRAPTPSAAAELVVPERIPLKNSIDVMTARLRNSLLKKIGVSRAIFEKLAASIAFKQPYNRIYQERMRLDSLNKSIHRNVYYNLENSRTRFKLLVGKLDALSPLTILARGYSIVKAKENGKFIKSVRDVRANDEVEVNVIDGKINCIVKGTETGETS